MTMSYQERKREILIKIGVTQEGWAQFMAIKLINRYAPIQDTTSSYIFRRLLKIRRGGCQPAMMFTLRFETQHKKKIIINK